MIFLLAAALFYFVECSPHRSLLTDNGEHLDMLRAIAHHQCCPDIAGLFGYIGSPSGNRFYVGYNSKGILSLGLGGSVQEVGASIYVAPPLL